VALACNYSPRHGAIDTQMIVATYHDADISSNVNSADYQEK